MRNPFFNVLGIFCLFVFFSGCDVTPKNNPDSPDAGESTDAGNTEPSPLSWKDTLKAAFIDSNPVLFHPRYIKDSKDAFYLRDTFEKSIELLKKGKPLSEELRNLLDTSADDYNLSKPIIEDQLLRTQEIYSIVSSIVADQAVQYMMVSTNEPIRSLFSDYMGTILSRPILNKAPHPKDGSQATRLPPLVDSHLLIVSKNYNEQVLNASLLYKNQNSNKGQNSSDAGEPLLLDSLVMKIRILSPNSALDTGMPLSKDTSPYFRNPLFIWNELSRTYAAMFEEVMSLIREDNNIKQAAHQKKNFDFRKLSSSLEDKLAKMKNLKETETKLLGELKLAVETQYKLSKELFSID